MDADHLLQLYLTLWLALLGAVLGSFLCCAADRGGLPRGRSCCDHCGRSLGAGELIPVVSYLHSRGRCRHCGGAIPGHVLGAEVAGAVGFAALAWRFGPCPELVMWLILAALLLLLSLIDGKEHLLPDKLLLAAAVNRVVFLFLLGQPLPETLKTMALGSLGIALVMDKVLGRESLGGGDIKLLFVLGLYLSLLEMLLLLVAACLLALVWALGRGKGEIPFGPFLAGGWLAVVLFGAPLLSWYQSLLR